VFPLFRDHPLQQCPLHRVGCPFEFFFKKFDGRIFQIHARFNGHHIVQTSLGKLAVFLGHFPEKRFLVGAFECMKLAGIRADFPLLELFIGCLKALEVFIFSIYKHPERLYSDLVGAGFHGVLVQCFFLFFHFDGSTEHVKRC
jgi:hypothetical protein